jgi:hypothetical protein
MIRHPSACILLTLAVFGCSSSEKTHDQPATGITMAMDECGLHTGYLGDENCIKPPPPDQGFQVHIGPSDYDNPEAIYVLQPSQEATDTFSAVSGNDQPRYFFYRQYRMRPTAHHMIMTLPNEPNPGGTFFVVPGPRIGTANRSEDYPVGGIVAPEDKDVGLPIPAQAAIAVSFHTINIEDTPQLREMWVNFWYKDASEVKEPAIDWFNGLDLSLDVPPLTQVTLTYTCSVDAPGRLLWLYGHRHANNVRFTAKRTRGSQTDVIYDSNKWEEPLLLEYASNVTNPAPDLAAGVEGGWNGILDLAAGDTIEWDCDIDNQQNIHLHSTDNTYTGEMCIIDAEAVGSSCR